MKVIENAGDNDYIYATLSYAVRSGKINNPKQFRKIIRRGLSPKSEETYMTLAEIFRKEGKQEGEQEGWRKGKQEGEQEGWCKGKQETAAAIANNLLKQGMPIDQIARATGLPISKIKNNKVKK